MHVGAETLHGGRVGMGSWVSWWVSRLLGASDGAWAGWSHQHQHHPPPTNISVWSCETRKEAVTFTSTPVPLNSAGARGQHRCAPGKIGGLAEAHTGSKKQSDIMWYPSRYPCRMYAYVSVGYPLGYPRMAQTPQRPLKVTHRPEGTWGSWQKKKEGTDKISAAE